MRAVKPRASEVNAQGLNSTSRAQRSEHVWAKFNLRETRQWRVSRTSRNATSFAQSRSVHFCYEPNYGAAGVSGRLALRLVQNAAPSLFPARLLRTGESLAKEQSPAEPSAWRLHRATIKSGTHLFWLRSVKDFYPGRFAHPVPRGLAGPRNLFTSVPTTNTYRASTGYAAGVSGEFSPGLPYVVFGWLFHGHFDPTDHPVGAVCPRPPDS